MGKKRTPAKPPKKAGRRGVVTEALEQRILFSADLPWLSPDFETGADGPVYEQRIDSQQSVAQQAGAEAAITARPLLLVDAELLTAEELQSWITARQTDHRLDVVELDESSDGINQLSTLLQDQQRSQVLIATNSDSSGLGFGESQLDTSQLLSRVNEVGGWAQHLDTDGSLRIYINEVEPFGDADHVTELMSALTRVPCELERCEDPAQLTLALDEAFAQLGLGDDADTVGAGDSEADLAPRELVFVDSRVDDYELVLEDIRNNSDDGRRIEVVLLDPNRDGTRQIAEALLAHNDLSAVHIISHGDSGRVELGATSLEASTLAEQSELIEVWGDSLAEGADLLFYGCDLAADSNGQAFIDSIAELTGADVAASDDLTGHAALGGDWQLEYTTGDIEAELPVTKSLITEYRALLDITSGLEAYYDFEEGSGTTAGDSAGGDNDGTLVNGPSWYGSGAVGSNALDFTGDSGGNNATVQVPDSANLDFSGDFTVAFWYQADTSASTSTRLVGSHDGSSGFSIYADPAGNLNAYLEGSTTSTTATASGGFIADGNWHQVVVTRSGNSISLHVDTSHSANSTQNLGTVNPSAPLTLGGESATISDYEGRLDEVRIYSRALSASDRAELFALGGGNAAPTTVADTLVTAAGTPLTITTATDLLANDSDPNGDALTITSFTQPGHGTVVDNADGTWTFTPGAGETGDAVFTYTVSDGNGGSSTSSVTIQQQGEWSITGDSSVTEGNSATYTVTFSGEHNASVELSLTDIETTSSDYDDFVAAVNAAIGARSDLSFDGTILNYSAPDEYSAVYDDSSSNFVDISGTGTALGLGDDDSSAQSIGFDFEFYGISYNQIHVGSNGQLTFGGASTAHSNQELTSGNELSGLPGILAYWDDLNPGSGSSDDVYVELQGSPGSQQLIVQYNNIQHYSSTGNGITFQVVLTEGSNEIEVRYQDTEFGNSLNNGASATIGITDGSSNFIQHGYNSASVSSDSRLAFSTSDPGMADLTISLGISDDGVGEASERFSVGLSNETTSLIAASSSVTTTITAINTAPTFDSAKGGDGVVISDYGASNQDDKGNDSVVQPDGRLLVVAESDDNFTVARYNTDGSLDTSFGTNGIVSYDVQGNDEARAIALQDDGKVVVAGFAGGDFGILRLNTDGTLDTSFGTGGEVIINSGDAYSAQHITIQPDGRILISGNGWDAYPGDQEFAIWRLNANGNIDTSFGNGGSIVSAFQTGSTSGSVSSTSLQSDGSIIAEERWWDGSNWNIGARRFDTSGTLDTSFGSGGYLDTALDSRHSQLLLNADDTFVVVSEIGDDFAIRKYGTDGTLDVSFGISGTTIVDLGGLDRAFNVATQSDGRYIISGESDGFVAATRLNTDGTLDLSFGNSGLLITTIASDNVKAEGDISVNPDDSFQIIATRASGGTGDDVVIARFNAVGSSSSSFDDGGVPIANSLNGNPTFFQRGDAVVLDADVEVSDLELSALDNFNGATLTLERSGGANVDDVFSSSGLLTTLTEGASLTYDGTTVGTVTGNSSGTLELTFNSNATNSLVNSVMQSIAYSNESATPASSLQIDWTFDDQNSGAQGSGGALAVTGNTTVTIIQTANPALTLPTTIATDENTTLVFSGANVIQVSDELAADSPLRVALSVASGTLTLSDTTGITFVRGADGLASMVIDGLESDLNAALDGLQFDPLAGQTGSVPLMVTTSISADLAGYYTFADGNANNQSESPAPAGTFVGDATVAVDATRGEALSLDGSGDYAQIDGVFGEPANVTFAAWVDLDAGRTNGEIISLGNSLGLRSDDNANGLSLFWYDGATWQFIGAPEVSLGGEGWNHVAATFDDANDTVSLYLNGVLVSSQTTTDSIAYNTDGNVSNVTTIGAHANGSSSFDFAGSIDDARVYTRALSAGEIAAIAGDQTTVSGSVAITVDAANDAPTFSVGDGTTQPGIVSLSDSRVDVAIQDDGRYLVLTSANRASSGQDIDYVLTRYNPDGSLDSSFGTNGVVVTAINTNNESPQTLTLQDDGRILVAGGYVPSGSPDSIVMRYNVDGTLDTTFSGDGMAEIDFSVTSTDIIRDMLVQPDGRILVVGYGNYSGVEQMTVARLNADGTLDTSFSVDGTLQIPVNGTGARAESVGLLSDGTIMIGGRAHNGTDHDFALVSLNADGTFNTNFDTDGISLINLGASDSGTAMVITPGDEILLAGTTNASGSGDTRVLKVDAAGDFVLSFGTGGLASHAVGSPFEAVNDMQLLDDGRIVIVGDAFNGSNNDVSVIRLNSDGSLDTGFDGDGMLRDNMNGATDSANAVAVDHNGDLIVVGNTSIAGSGETFVSRINNDATYDAGFDPVNTLDGNPTFVEDGAPVVLDADVQIFDAELSVADSFDGATLTLARSGGANVEDEFSATGSLGALTEGNSLIVGATTIGTVTTNTSGTLQLTFNAAATNDLVDAAMQQIAYSNSNDGPPASVQIDWVFDDGNSGAQGSGGVGQATGSTIVNITAVSNDAITDAHYTTWLGRTEFVVNTETSANQDSQSVTALTDGGFVVAWESFNQDGDAEGIYFQRYNSAGNPVGVETAVNSTTADAQTDPEITALANGGFVVVWESELQDGDERGVYARVFDSTGTAATAEIHVSSAYTADDQDTATVIGLTGGGFVVSWESRGQDGDGNGAFFQRYSDAGVAQGSTTQIDATTSSDQGNPRMAATDDGGFVVAWHDYSTGDGEVKAQRYDATGAALGAEIAVNSTTAGSQNDPDIAALSGGGFVVVWESEGQDGDDNGVYAQRFDALGGAVGSEFQVNATTAFAQQDHRVEALPDGGFVVVWESGGDQDGNGYGAYAQQFDAAGNQINGEFQLNDTTNQDQNNPDLAVLNDGRLIAVWEGDLQDGDSNGVIARLFTPALNENSPIGTVAAVVSQIVDPDVGDTYTYALTNNAGGAFDIQSDGSITVADPSLLDYENNPSLTVTVRITDPVSGFHDEVVTIRLTDLAEAVQSVPGAQSVVEDETLIFSAGNGNAVTVSDTLSHTDALLQVSLSVNDGTLTLSQTTGLTFVEGTNGSAQFVVSGTESDLNAALESMAFAPDASFVGSVTLNMTTTLASDLIGFYNFTSGSVNDQSAGTAYNGTLVNGTVTSDADRGDVLSLDGTGDFVRIDGLLGEPSSVTLAAWIDATSTDTFGAVAISMGRSPALYLEADGRLTGFYESGGTNHVFTTTETLLGTGWRHVALTIDSGAEELSVFIDGQLVGVTAASLPIEYDNGPDTYIGRAGDGGTGFDFGGQIDDARIYSRALTAEEISALATDATEVHDSVAITVTPGNDAPVLTTNPGGGTYYEGSFTNYVDTSATVTDADNTDFDGGTLTATLTNNGTSSDRLTIIHEGTGAGELEVAGSDLRIDGVVIGTFTGGVGVGDPLVITFNAQADAAGVTTVAQHVGYENVSEAPSTAQRQITLQVTDGDGGTSGNGVRIVNVVAVNDAPEFNQLDGNPTFTEGNAAVVLDADVTVFDHEINAGVDNFSGASLSLVRNGSANSEDAFSATGLLGALTEGSALTFNGSTLGTVTTNSAGALLLTFNGTATHDDINDVMQAIAYANSSDAPPASVQIDWTFNDGNAGPQGTGSDREVVGSTTVNIIGVNDPVVGQPVITGTPQEDETLGVDTSGITDADGLGVFSYQWYRDGVAISGATSATFSLGDADVGANITVTVSYTDGQGTAESTTSASVGPIVNVNDAVVGQPAITGTATEDETLGVDTSGISDDDGLGAFSYQWYRDGVAISGATSTTYTLDDADVGANLTITVSYTDGHGTAESTTSAALGPIANVNDPVAGQPVITGTPTEDETLSVDASGISDDDGLGAYSYQWYRDGVAISGATASTYTLVDADVASNITVTLSYTDANGTAESTTSAAVGPVANVNDPVSGQPVITGTPTEDETLSVDTSGISDDDGLGAFSYQWYRDGIAISGATTTSYTLDDVDVGSNITVTVSYTDARGTAESATSAAVGPISNVNDPVAGQPVITGTPTEDETLGVDTSGISDDDGLGSFSYQWYRDGVAISGATGSTYTLGDLDVDSNIIVTVSYTDDEGTAESTTSAAVGPISNVNDPVSGQPVITGTPTEDETLSVDTSGISDADGLGSFSYQWYRDGVAISGATASSYTLGDPDVDANITVTVSYTDSQGTAESTTSTAVGPITNVNDSVSGQPVITGTPTEDETLSVDTSGISDADGLGSFSYQWYRDGVAISGATASSYTLGDPDVDANITVTVSYTDSQGTAESTTSTAVGPITNVNDSVSGQPVITGTPTEGETLSVDTSGISDADGLGSFSYQWYRDGVAIGGATASSYTLGDADVDANITVTVSYTDAQGTAESTTSAAVGPIANVNDPVGGQPVITGTPTEDETLSVDTSGISDADGLGSFSYQWYRDGVAISGATASNYTLDDTDVDANITVTVSYTDSQGTAESTTSAAIGPIANVNDPVGGQPVITGTPTEDETLSVDTSGISDNDGLGSFSYQWYRDGVAISGATASSYTLGDADVDANITVTVSYTDAQGTAESTTSAAVGPIANVNDPVTGQPVITGTPTEDETLSVDTSGISDADGLGSFSYQWYRDGAAISGATTASYNLGDADVDANITVTVSYTDAQGTAESTTSAAVGPIANVNDPVSGQPVITGTPTEDETLSVDTSGISDNDGLGAFSYQWYRDGVAISGATASNYTLADADVDANITVAVSYTDAQGTAESTTSNAVGPITNVNDPVSGQPVITGTATEDETLGVDTSGISDNDGLGSFSYQWYRDGVAISGATASTYTLGDADVDSNITVTVSYTDAHGTAESTTSAAVGPIANVNDPVSGQPVITGTPTEDETLTVDTSGISDNDGLGAFSYQWYRDGVAISGATASSYTLGDADVDANITVNVSYIDSQGTAESTTSAAVGPIANVNDPVAGQPVIIGTPTEDETLSVDTSGISDNDGLGAFSYQWYRDGVAISGATAPNYTLGDLDVDANITVTVSYTDAQGNAENTTSAAVGPITNVNDPVSGQPVITGTPTEDETLSVDTSGINDNDGLGTFSYQWYRDGVAISGATASTYTLGDVDVDASITVMVSYTDAQGTAESTTSAAVGPIANVNDPVSGQPVITGTPTEDETLSVDASGISDNDGLGSYSYQWYRDGVAISGATASTYTLGDADVDANITVTVSYTDAQGTAESTTSAAVGPIANVNDPVSGQPVITGTPTEDETLSVDTSGISDNDGLGAYSYQWYRDGVAISGATASSYNLGDADVDANITVTVSYTDVQGTAENTTSAAVGPIGNVNDPVAGQPVITGTPTENETLSVDTSGISDADGLGSFSYQWYRDGAAISGATAASYTLGDADVDANITVTVSYTDAQGTAESTTSNAVGPIANVNDPVAGQPVITGTPTEDETLSVDTSGISDADGLGAFSYQWHRDGVAISGATAASYTLVDADVDANITVTVSYTDAQGTAENTTSAAVGPIANVNDPVAGQPIITGTPTEDETLSVDTSGISDNDGLGSFSYQWYRDGAVISGATASSYTLGDADVDANITVTVSYTDAQGTAENTTSAAVGPIANVNDPVAGQPVITGTPTEDETLSVDTSGISDADGLGAFSYQWHRDGVAISGANASSYTLGDADVDANITVTVSYTDAQGTAESTTSNAVGPIANVNDPVAGQPVITGTQTEDETLNVDTSGITDNDGLGPFSYQWYRDGAVISGATASSYTLGDADVDANITVTVSYTDAQGTAESATSNAVGPIANVNDPVSGQPVITGTPTEDETLSVDTSGIGDADGIGSFSYQWNRDGVAISGATASSYTLGDADVDANITVTVSYTDAKGTAENTTSAAVGPITNVNDPVAGQPIITGTPTEDETLSVDTSGISDADGLGAFSYQWHRDGVAISGATASSYTLGDADVDANITVTVSYTDVQGTAENTTSAAVGPITNVNDPVVGQPVITGTPTEDETLGVDTSGISDNDGLGSFSYQWYRDGVAISGATAASYTLGDADVGTNITVTVGYTDAQGTDEVTTSAAVGPIVNVNDLVTGQPIITGTSTEDETLSVDTSGISDDDGLGAFSYQWQRDGVTISGATSDSYTLGDEDVNASITVTVSYTDNEGTAESTTSAPVGPIANVNDPVSGLPVITGTAEEDQTLTIDTSGISDNDGLGTFGFQWFRDGAAITGATSASYTLGDDDVDANISVTVSYIDSHGTAENTASVPVGAIANVNDAVVGQPIIVGTPQEDETLTADTTTISDNDGLGTFSYQWFRDGVAIGGATNATHTLGDADVGSNVTVTVRYTDGHGTPEETSSAAVGPVANVNDAVVGLPVITGAPQEDQTVSADMSGVSDADGMGTLSYQWLRNGVAIAGETNSTLTLGDADVGTQISVTVSFVDGYGNPESVTSLSVGPVANVNDAPVATGDQFSMVEDSTLVIDITGDLLANDTDIDGDALSLAGLTQPQHGFVIDNLDGTLTYQPDADYNGVDSFTYTVDDGNGGTHTATVNVNIGAVNDAPAIAASADQTILEGDALATQIQATDVDGDAMSYSITGGADADLFQIDAQTGAVTSNTQADYEAPVDSNADNRFELEVTVLDGQGGATQIPITLEIANRNETPELDDARFDVTPNRSIFAGQLKANDPDSGDALTFSIVGGNDLGHFQIDANTGALTVSPAAPAGMHVLTAEITDSDGAKSTATVQVFVQQDENDRPINTGDQPQFDPEANEETESSPPEDADPPLAAVPDAEPVSTEESAPELIVEQVTLSLPDVEPIERSTPDRDLQAPPADVVSGKQTRAERFLLLNFEEYPEFASNAVDMGLHKAGFMIPISPELADALDALAQEVMNGPAELDLKITGAIAGTVTLSAGFIIWVLRAGSLMASILATRPVWKDFDPLPVLGSGS